MSEATPAAAVAAVRFKLAALRLRVALVADALERRYNPDWALQPRVPSGNPDGGRWTDGGGGTEVALGEMGTLLGRAPVHETHGGGQDCFYQFSYGIVVLRFSANVGCPPTVPWFAATHGHLIK